MIFNLNLFEKQTVESLNKVIEKFENIKFDYKKIREHSKNFRKEKFQKQLLKFIDEKYSEIKTIQN